MGRRFGNDGRENGIMSSGGWRNGGRPKGSTSKKPTRSVSQHIRWTQEEWEAIEAKAEERGITASALVREMIYNKVKKK